MTKAKTKNKNLHNRYAMSYSGLKTAVIHHARRYWLAPYNQEAFDVNDLLASFQKSAFSSLISKSKRAAKDYDLQTVGVCGGVSASKTLKQLYEKESFFTQVIFPKKKKYCLDNAAMIAGLGGYIAKAKPELSKTNFDQQTLPLKQASQSPLFQKLTKHFRFKPLPFKNTQKSQDRTQGRLPALGQGVGQGNPLPTLYQEKRKKDEKDLK